MSSSSPVRRRLLYAVASAISLPSLAPTAFAQSAGAIVALPEVVVEGAPPSASPAPSALPSAKGPAAVVETPTGQVQTDIGSDRTVDTRDFSIGSLLLDSPGVTIKQGNGPRDIGISIRGSNARNGFGIRNIVLFDDGFPLTQPDGLSRSDNLDPHAYAGVDVVRGPSSALYGDYATGGAIQFHTYPGAALDGVEIGTDGGSYGYLNNYLLYGKKSGPAETSVFASTVVGDSLTSHSAFDTQTVNAVLRYEVTPEDRLVFKAIENHLHTDLSNRLSLNQFFLNPYQHGCAAAQGAALGCQTLNVFANGSNGRTVALSADQEGEGRNDNRAIFGARYEHDFGTLATWRTQVTLDDRNYNQPIGTMSSIGDVPSLNVISDAVLKGQLFGHPSLSYAALYINTLSTVGYAYNIGPGGNGALGSLYSVVPSTQTNVGGRVREEVKLTDTLLLTTGLDVGKTFLRGQSTSYTYAAPNVVGSVTSVAANNTYLNTAPEASLTYRPTAQWQVLGRVGTGYGTPNASNLFTTMQGLAGNNTSLKSQTNVGYDLSASYTPTRSLTVTLDGFYEFFHGELISQSPGPGLMSYTFNAPHSEHRGVEAFAKWAFAPGFLLTAVYTYDNQVYTQFDEKLSTGGVTASLNRAGNRIPGVPLNELLLRLGYDVPGGGTFAGLGAYVEYIDQTDFFVDNGNLLKSPGYGIVDLNLHYARPLTSGPFRDVWAYVEVRNLANTTYVASANNLTDQLTSTAASLAGTAGSIYAGTPRSVYGGVRLRF